MNVHVSRCYIPLLDGKPPLQSPTPSESLVLILLARLVLSRTPCKTHSMSLLFLSMVYAAPGPAYSASSLDGIQMIHSDERRRAGPFKPMTYSEESTPLAEKPQIACDRWCSSEQSRLYLSICKVNTLSQVSSVCL